MAQGRMAEVNNACLLTLWLKIESNMWCSACLYHHHHPVDLMAQGRMAEVNNHHHNHHHHHHHPVDLMAQSLMDEINNHHHHHPV